MGGGAYLVPVTLGKVGSGVTALDTGAVDEYMELGCEFESAGYDLADVVQVAQVCFDDIDTRSRRQSEKCIVGSGVGTVALDEEDVW